MIEQYLAGIWPLIGYFGFGGSAVVACLAAAWFSPVFKKEFVWAAALIAAVMAAVGFGVNMGEKRVQAQWDQARAAAVDNAKKARAGAIRDVARKPSKWVRNKPDPFDRDRH